MKVRDVIYLLVCVSLFMLLVLQLDWPMVDDTYIHLKYAESLAERGELSFNRGEPSYGATSPLWVLILAVVDLMGGNTITWCRVLSCVFAFLSVVMVYFMVIGLTGKRWLGLVGAIIMSSEAWLVRWSSVGMETSLAVFMVLVVIWAWKDVSHKATGSVVFAILLFLAFITRPELVLVFPLAIVAYLMSVGRRINFYSCIWVVVFIPLVVIWLLFIKNHTGTFLPLTAGAKQGNPVLSFAMVKKSIVPLKIFASTVGIPWLLVIGAVLAGLLVTGSPLAFFLPPDKKEKYGPVVILSLLWVVALPILYVVLDFRIISRYLLPVNVVIIFLAVVSVYYMASRLNVNSVIKKVIPVVVMVLVVAQNILFFELVVVRPTREFSQGLSEVMVKMGRWLKDNSPPQAMVALCDIGAVGYYSDRKVLDLGGLVTPVINDMRQYIAVETIINEGLYLYFKPDYFIDRSEVPARFADRVIRGTRFVEIMRGTVANLGIRKPGPVVYVLYRLERVDQSKGR